MDGSTPHGWGVGRYPPAGLQKLALIRLSLRFSTTFLSFFRSTTDPVAAQKVRCRVRQFGGIFIFCVVVDRILIFVVWVRFSGACSARFPKELDLLEPGNAKFCSPVQYCSPRLETRPQLSSTFGLSLPYRKFRKNFRESLIRAKLSLTARCLTCAMRSIPL